jgi:hypothetical protein
LKAKPFFSGKSVFLNWFPWKFRGIWFSTWKMFYPTTNQFSWIGSHENSAGIWFSAGKMFDKSAATKVHFFNVQYFNISIVFKSISWSMSMCG